jgi:hypothetical protein
MSPKRNRATHSVEVHLTARRWGLRNLIGRISEKLPFRIATLLTKAEFDVRYPV